MEPTDFGPQLLLELPKRDGSHWAKVALGTVIVQCLTIFLSIFVVELPTPDVTESEERTRPKQYTPLYVPLELTQKEANKGKAVKEVKLDQLLPKPTIQTRTPAPPIMAQRKFQAPPAVPLPPKPQAPVIPPAPDTTRLEASAKAPQAAPPPVLNVPPPPPPQIQPVEKPKLAFETPGQGGTGVAKGGSQMKIPVARNSVDDAIRTIARGGGAQGGISVGDEDTLPTLPDPLRRNPSPGRMQSSVELKSDPLGVDFKPYLIRLLAQVRRNWFAVWPESARLGLRGTVSLRVVIDKVGQVPHLDINGPSGANALDRAAVASISASIPFSPLPAEFKSDKIILVLRFQYN